MPHLTYLPTSSTSPHLATSPAYLLHLTPPAHLTSPHRRRLIVNERTSYSEPGEKTCFYYFWCCCFCEKPQDIDHDREDGIELVDIRNMIFETGKMSVASKCCFLTCSTITAETAIVHLQVVKPVS